MSIAENIQHINNEIEEAASRAGRDPSDITLVAVSKTRTVDEIRAAADNGILHFGENRVQEASSKIPEVTDDVVWHMIGPLQSNKAKPAVEHFDWVDSVHSAKIVDVLSAQAARAGRVIKILVQMNISGEESKSGVHPDKARELIGYAIESDGLDVCGLMAIGSFGVSYDITRAEYARMRELFDSLRDDAVLGPCMKVLSMGMSGDFGIAIEEGATMVRVGTAIFGRRDFGRRDL